MRCSSAFIDCHFCLSGPHFLALAILASSYIYILERFGLSVSDLGCQFQIGELPEIWGGASKVSVVSRGDELGSPDPIWMPALQRLLHIMLLLVLKHSLHFGFMTLDYIAFRFPEFSIITQIRYYKCLTLFWLHLKALLEIWFISCKDASRKKLNYFHECSIVGEKTWHLLVIDNKLFCSHQKAKSLVKQRN